MPDTRQKTGRKSSRKDSSLTASGKSSAAPTPPAEKSDNKVARLFTYLEKALALDDTVVRDFRTTTAAPSPWWIANLPDDADNLMIRKFDTDKIVEDEATEDHIWLRVEKKSVKAAPQLPPVLREWVEEITPLAAPKAKEKIDRKIQFDQDDERVRQFKAFRKGFKQGDQPPALLQEWVVLNPAKLPEVIPERYTEDFFADHPELRSFLDAYTRNDWKPWAHEVIKTYKANLLYDELYALRLLLKNEGDSYELLWGHGLLSWQHTAVGTIHSPIFLTPLTLEFDAAKRVIEISPDPMLKGFVDLSALHDMDNPAEMDLITWADKINTSPFDFWHYQTLKSQTRFLINTLSPSSEDNFGEELVASTAPIAAPSIWNAPVIFARKRSNDLWSNYAGIIRRDLEQNEIEPTEFIRDLVGDYTETERSVSSDSERETNLSDSELFFPLPWNDEQKRIAERLDANYGVVVKGPPGTGKSHTIANLISRFLSQGKTVLVTSQTSKALEVLRDKLPENIRSLAVSQLHQHARRDDVLQQSIGEISSNLGERYTKFSEDKSDSVRRELQRVREEKASLANQIREYVLTDSSVKINIDGAEIRPMDAAKLVSEHRDKPDDQWLTDKVDSEAELNFTTDDLNDAYRLLKELSTTERALHRFELPPLESLPAVDVVTGAFSLYREHSAKFKTSSKVLKDVSKGLPKDKVLGIWDQLHGAKKVLASITKDYEKEVFASCVASKGAREKWQTVLSKISEKIQLIDSCNARVLGNEVEGEVNFPINDLVDAVTHLKKKVDGGVRIGTFTKILLPANCKRILESYKVNGRTPDTAETIEVLHKKILIKQAEKEIKVLLEQGFSNLKSSLDIDGTDMIQLEVAVSGLQRVVGYCDDFAAVDAFCKEIKPLSHLSFVKLEDIVRLLEIVSSDAARFEMENLERDFTAWIALIEEGTGKKKHPAVEGLLEAVQKRNTTGWKKTIEELTLLHDKKQKATRLKELWKKIGVHAPNLFKEITAFADQKESFEAPGNLAHVWKIARLESWLDTIHDRVDIDSLQGQLERLTKKEYQLNSELVTILAWQRQIDKVTKKQRDALMAWSLAMKKYGKGTGKYALTHLRAAQDALKEAKSAVPVWIMPLQRAAQMFPEPKAGMFDVVIFDEASQCDIKGLTIGYLGKKLLVVGDPEQISPAGIFQNQEKIFELISRFLHDIPFKESFSVTSSFFDLAKIRLSNVIQLNEHFRCVPEIIAFSNHHIYEGKLKPLRYPHPKGLLAPALVPVFVQEGFQNTNNKVNEPEARAIVAKLIECLSDPRYQERPDGRLCTFGIVSLLAVDQAKYIEKLLRDEIGKGTITEKTIEERRIECGDAYKFQGDERDVMFLSMVRALDSSDTNDTVAALADEGAKRRFNVAASRARDQMFLFHSIPLKSLGNKNDWRYKLLAWFYDPKHEELKAGREALKREFNSGNASQFSFDVGNLLIDRGYQVMPEYPVIGYRIDLVVQGTETRLAVECDGDQYHTLDRWEEDQAREQQLRRAGWEFWRVTGSAFYRHKENALDSLWKKLDELGIKPIVGQ